MQNNIRYDYRYDTLAAVRQFGSYTLAGQMTRKINIFYRKDFSYDELLQKIQTIYSQIS